MSKTYRSAVLAAIHETASDLHDAGVMNKQTLREFDKLCLAPVRPMSAAESGYRHLTRSVERAEFVYTKTSTNED